MTWEHNVKHYGSTKDKISGLALLHVANEAKNYSVSPIDASFNSGAGDLDDLGVVHGKGEDELPLWYCRV